ncbi:hypothetical protein BDW42DRAFT_168432 [Aspergillus taichungensis]|uniref:Uncharacterized protein n=1 Tax=Aspergillus taichungensis TaxID=482145 RepID=A0A2J5HWA0_9EURO|nr:hypothetical protein BDW42DRAFT_168432 [Aspergillus taichungensis]
MQSDPPCNRSLLPLPYRTPVSRSIDACRSFLREDWAYIFRGTIRFWLWGFGSGLGMVWGWWLFAMYLYLYSVCGVFALKN